MDGHFAASSSSSIVIIISLTVCIITPVSATSWSEWWTYEGISGPDFWGLVNPDWFLCSRGLHQSPVDVDPRRLLYDPHLSPFRIERQKVDGTLINTGHDLKLVLDDASSSASAVYVNISGGPLAYQYRIHELSIHFGRDDTRGSEHCIENRHFPAELQILAYNADLYINASQALLGTHGLCVITLLAQVGDIDVVTEEFDRIIRHVTYVKYKGQEVRMLGVRLDELLPATSDYVTYDGSLTQPGCQETVTWLLLNKPIYVTQRHLSMLRKLMQGDVDNPKVAMENNFRPIQPLNQRSIRTNINFHNATSVKCPIDAVVYYRANIGNS